MLVVEPERRLSLRGVARHRWLQAHQPGPGPGHYGNVYKEETILTKKSAVLAGLTSIKTAKNYVCCMRAPLNIYIIFCFLVFVVITASEIHHQFKITAW